MPDRSSTPRVRIEPWSEGNLDLLRRINVPAMKAHLGGTESEEKLLLRNRRELHAFPSVHNRASNAICRKLGFRFVAEVDFEYPPGSMIRSNDWCLELAPVD